MSLLERAAAMARVLPPYARVWINDETFESLSKELVATLRYTPFIAEPIRMVYVKHVAFLPRSTRVSA